MLILIFCWAQAKAQFHSKLGPLGPSPIQSTLTCCLAQHHSSGKTWGPNRQVQICLRGTGPTSHRPACWLILPWASQTAQAVVFFSLARPRPVRPRAWQAHLVFPSPCEQVIMATPSHAPDNAPCSPAHAHVRLHGLTQQPAPHVVPSPNPVRPACFSQQTTTLLPSYATCFNTWLGSLLFPHASPASFSLATTCSSSFST